MAHHLAAAGKRRRTRRLQSAEVYPPGEPLFPLREMPKYEALEALARRFPELDPSAAEAYLVLLRVSTDILAAMDTHLGRHGLSKGRFSVLMLLLRADEDGISPSVLADRSGVTRATITGLVDGLEREGFIRREGSRDDRRSHAVRLTPRGEEFLRDMLPGYFRRVAGLMAKLTAGERKTLVRLLARVNEGLSCIRDP
jgi:DNA-binding MarR family transcriptional regulator